MTTRISFGDEEDDEGLRPVLRSRDSERGKQLLRLINDRESTWAASPLYRA